MKIKETKFKGIYEVDKKLATKTELKKPLFNEKIKEKYRFWDPSRSKLAAAIKKGIKKVPLEEGNTVLYLGAAHGYTPSFISDIVSKKGIVFCIEFAPRVTKQLVFNSEKKENMIPLLVDANKPETYKNRITNADVIYQDIAQKNQLEILFKNLKYLKNKGYCLLAIKARSIDVTEKPRKIFKEIHKKLATKLSILDHRVLDPYEKDHCFFICQKK